MTETANLHTFSFDLGDPMPMLDKADFFDLYQCSPLKDWLEPPVNFSQIARLLLSSAHHQSALEMKKNVLLSTMQTSERLPRQALEQLVMDYLIFGNAYLQIIKNPLGEIKRIYVPLAKYVRKNADNVYYFINGEKVMKLKNVFHLKNLDINQNIYGMPSYLGAIQSLLLNESATLFRRKYYINGAHAGSIIYANDAGLTRDDVLAVQRELAKTKGKGNFKNLFLYAPNGRADGLKVIPLSDAVGKDDFLNIKNTSRDDILAAHRVPPQLMGLLPNNVGGFGDVEKAANVFFINEIKPLQNKFDQINSWLNETVLTFTDYELAKQAEKKA